MGSMQAVALRPQPDLGAVLLGKQMLPRKALAEVLAELPLPRAEMFYITEMRRLVSKVCCVLCWGGTKRLRACSMNSNRQQVAAAASSSRGQLAASRSERHQPAHPTMLPTCPPRACCLLAMPTSLACACPAHCGPPATAHHQLPTTPAHHAAPCTPMHWPVPAPADGRRPRAQAAGAAAAAAEGAATTTSAGSGAPIQARALAARSTAVALLCATPPCLTPLRLTSRTALCSLGLPRAAARQMPEIGREEEGEELAGVDGVPKVGFGAM